MSIQTLSAKLAALFKKTSIWLLLVSLQVQTAIAQKLPTVEAPTRGEGKGIFETMRNYAYDGAIFIGLAVATVGFLAVAWHSIAAFSDVQNGKKKWGDLGAVVVVGIMLLVAAIWLLTKAAEIL